MKVGAVYPQIETGGDAGWVRPFGLAMEELGVSHLLAYDHVVGAAKDREPKLQGPYTEKDPFHDPFMLFSYLAAITQKLEFATGILILPQRQTVLVAKQATDLDLLSGGRFRMGVGTGWNYVEYQALGQPFESRGQRLDEQIDFLRKLWREPLLTFEGKFDRIDRGNINIRPKRLIPIWCGGYSEPAFRRAVKLGDGFIFAAADVDKILEGWTTLQRLLAEAGRPLSGFGSDIFTMRTSTVESMVDSMKKWRDAGGTHFSINTMGKGLKGVQAHIDFVADVVAKFG